MYTFHFHMTKTLMLLCSITTFPRIRHHSLILTRETTSFRWLSPFEGIYELIVYYWNQTTKLMDYILKLNTTRMREQVLTQWISYFKYFAQHYSHRFILHVIPNESWCNTPSWFKLLRLHTYILFLKMKWVWVKIFIRIWDS